MKINHLLFEDDVLLFSHGDKNSIIHLMQCLEKFSNISGLFPNAYKSTVYFSNCFDEVVTWFDNTFHIPHGCLPVKFFRVSLISFRLCVDDCLPLIDKLTSRMNLWTARLLSLAGRAQLIKAVLCYLEAYWTNHFILPRAVHRHIQQLLTHFLCKGDCSRFGGAKVSWIDVCLPRDEGGLGFRNPEEWNFSQIMRHLCKIVNKDASLWVSWVHSTYLKFNNFWTMEKPTDCSWIWRRILTLRPIALRFIRYNFGNGRATSLWFDPWWHHLLDKN